MSFAEVGPSVHVLRKDTMMANSAVLGSILVMLGFAFDAVPVSDVVGLRGD